MKFAYQVVINLTTEGTLKWVHCVMTETHAGMKRVTRVQCSWIFFLFCQEPYLESLVAALKKAIGLTTTLHWHLAFCTFLCRHCTTTTWKCPFVEGKNTIRPLSFSFFELRYSLRSTEGEEIIANTLFLSDVFVAVTVIVSWAPSRERGVKFRHVVYRIWSVSYLFFSFQIWYLRK